MSDTNIEDQLRTVNSELNRRIASLEKTLAEKERALAALQASEKRYRQLFESARDGILILDADTGKVVDVNPFLLQLLGYSYNELRGKHLWEIGLFKDIAASKDAFKTLQDNEYIRYEDLLLQTHDGQPVDVEFVSNVYLLDHTKVIQCNIRDITKRKQAEEALLESENKFKSFAEQALAGIYILQNGVFKYVNAKFAQMFGYTVEECLNDMHFQNLVYAEDVATVEEQVRRRTSGETESVHYTFRGLKKNGQIFHAEVYGATSVYKGEPAGAGTILDITKRKRAEKALRESEEKYRRIVETANEGICVVGVDNLVTYVNQKIADMLGYLPEEIIGKPLVHFLFPEDLADHQEKWSHRIQGLSETYERRFRRSDGRECWANVSVTVIRAEDARFMGAFGMLTDITERKRAEEELKDSEQLLKSIIQGYPIPTFMIGKDHRVIYWNKALEEMSKIKANEVVGTSEHWRAFYREKRPCMADLLVDENQEGAVRWYGERTGKSEALNEAYEATEFVTCLGETGKWLHFTAAALRNSRGTIVGAIETLEDITDREKAEEVLRESENRYRAIFENTGAATIILEEDTTISLANAEFEKLTGYTKDEIENKKSWTEYVAKEDLERMLDQHRLRRVDAKAALKQYEFRLIDRHDQTRDCLLTVDMIADTKRSIASFLDITERKNAEKALHESELRLRTILQTVNEGFWLIDNDTVTTDLNPRMCAILGRNREEVLGRKIFDFVDSENKAIFEQQIRLRAQGEVGTYEIALSRPDGSNVFCLFNATPLFDGSGNKAGSFAMVTDISERKLAEIALRESEERFARFFRSTPVGTSITRFSDGQFADINDAFLVLFGYIREEVIGQNALKLGMWANPQDRAKMFEVLQEQGRLQDFETMFRRKSGEIMDVLISAEVIEMAGQQYMLCLTHDITERKRAEEERRGLEDRLQRAEKMEALGTLAGGVAHDLNNVLGIVVGYSELLVDELIESGSARSKALEILKGGQRAGAIVQDLLTLARRGVSNRKALNLNNIVLEFLDSPEFAGISSYHPNIRLKTDLEAHLLNISGSAVHLSKSLMNLVSNAAEAMPQGGVITIKTGNQYLDKPVSGYDEVRESDYVVLSVSDMGQGIPANDMKRIFEPFYTKKVMGRSGTGLGLAVIWGTVKDHLGYINVGSQEGKGTTFTLYFPVTREEISREQVSISAAEYMGNGESILIVDDVKEQRELAGTMLEKLNYTVVTVSSGEEAVEYLKQNAVDLLVLDMIMDPGMDGLDTYAKVLEIHPRQRAIIVSGFSETKRVSRAQALGAGAYVKKPYLLEKLGLAVRKELDQPA